MQAVNRPAIRGMGALIVLLGIWGGLAPFLGPAINFGSGPSWTWSESSNTLHVVPGIAAILAGTMLFVGRRGSLSVLASALAIAAGAWFVVGPSLHQIWASSSTTASQNMSGSGRMSGSSASGSTMGSSHMSGSSMGTRSASSSSGAMAMGMGTSGSGSTKGALEAVAYHYGTGAAIAVLGSVSLGLLLAAPAAAVAGASASEERRRRLDLPAHRPAEV